MTQTHRPLLAKGPRTVRRPDGTECEKLVTVVQHTRDVLNAFQALFGTVDAPTSLTETWVRFFKLGDPGAFLVNGRRAALLHDLGKVNDGFQRTVRGAKENGQAIWHEHLSALILHTTPELRAWLNESPGGDADVVLAAVAGHHLRAGRRTGERPTKLGVHLPGTADAVCVPADGLREVLAADPAAVPPGAADGTLPVESRWRFGAAGGRAVKPAADSLARQFRKWGRAIADDDPAVRLLWATRAGLIAADAAASGLTRENRDVLAWIADQFERTPPLTGDIVWREVMKPRIEQINAAEAARAADGGREPRPFAWQDFQTDAATLPDRALMLAACGSGKTLAAWRWIAARLDERPARRVVFLYPTRATASEGFRDYVSWAPEADAALLHGTSAYDLQGLFDDSGGSDDPRGGRRYETEERLFAVGCWQKRIFSATVDQFLGFMQHAYGSVCLLPVLADSVVVADEVHSFDRGLWAALKELLARFDVPVLCMTASLPEHRVEQLRDLGLARHPKDPAAYADLRRRADMPRYQIERVADRDAAEAVVRDSTARRVLWVVNTVDRCQEAFDALREWGGRFDSTLCYHSRFTLEDRKRRHGELIAAFAGGETVIAFTTQVCEMSLDLDADLLVTETAPVTALIQRMGRCNRRARPHADGSHPPPGRVIVYDPPGEADERRLPYEEDDLGGVNDFLAAAAEGVARQTDLQRLLERHAPASVEPDRYTAFTQSGPFAVNGETALRDADDRSVQAILDDRLFDFLKDRRAKRPTDGYVLPAPRKLAADDPRLGGYPKVVPAENYDDKVGLCRQPRPLGAF